MTSYFFQIRTILLSVLSINRKCIPGDSFQFWSSEEYEATTSLLLEIVGVPSTGEINLFENYLYKI